MLLLNDIYERGCGWFAEANHCKVSQRSFSLATLARAGVTDRDFCQHGVLDHAEFFRSNRRAFAIVGHNYPDPGDEDTRRGVRAIAKAAAALGLVVHVGDPAASWWFPGVTIPIVVMRRGFRVSWLTAEQVAETARDHAAYMEWVVKRQTAREAKRANP